MKVKPWAGKGWLRHPVRLHGELRAVPILPSVTQGFCCLSAGLSGDRGTCPVQEPRRCPCFAPLSPRGGGTWGAASRHPRALSPPPVHPSTRGGGPAGLGDSSGTARGQPGPCPRGPTRGQQVPTEEAATAAAAGGTWGQPAHPALGTQPGPKGHPRALGRLPWHGSQVSTPWSHPGLGPCAPLTQPPPIRR